MTQALTKASASNTRRAEKVRTEWRVVTPELAFKWLEGNTHNRKVRDSVVQRFASDMRNGRWRQSHQGIAFDEDNVLIDGQHRLYAITEAQVDVLMQVTYGLPMDTQMVVDDGLTRTVLDVMRVSNDEMAGITTLHASVATRMFAGMSQSKEVRLVTRQERAAFLKRHWDAINFVLSHFPVSKRINGVTRSGPLAACARAYYHEKRAELGRFLTLLFEGINVEERDLNVIKLRNWLMQHRSQGGGLALESYGKTERTLKAFVRHEKPYRNILSATEELYPLPKS